MHPPSEPQPSKVRHKRQDPAIKRQILQLITDGHSIPQLADEFGISVNTLYDWHRKMRLFGGGVTPPEGVEELRAENLRLREELRRAQEREEILKKSLGIICEPSRSAIKR